jgi:hypothetical protein
MKAPPLALAPKGSNNREDGGEDVEMPGPEALANVRRHLRRRHGCQARSKGRFEPIVGVRQGRGETCGPPEEARSSSPGGRSRSGR